MKRLLRSCLLTAALVAAAPALALDLFDPPARPGALAPHLAATQAGGALATWVESTKDGARVRFARFSSAGWSDAVTVVENRALFANWADTPGVAESGDGTLLAWWLEKVGAGTYAYGIGLARSRDDGASWTALGRLDDDASESEHGFVSMVAEGQGLRAFWLDGRATPSGGAMSLRTTTIGAEVAPSELVDARVCDCCKTAAASVMDGTRVAYRDRSAEEIRDIAVAAVPASGATEGVRVAADGWKIAGCPVNGPELAMAGGRLAIAWYSAAADEGKVQLAFSDDAGARFGAPLIVDDAAPLGRVALARAEGDQVVVGWLGRAGANAEVRLARADGRGVARPLVVATTSAGRTSGFPQVARLAGESLLVVWTDAGAGETQLRGRRLTLSELAAP